MTIDRDKIMNRKQFYKLGRADQRALMAHWRIVYSTEEIKKELGISTTAFYALLKRLDLPTNLKAYRDASPSLLGERNTEASKMNSNPPTSSSKTFEVEVGVTGRVDVNELPSVLEFAKEHHLELTLNATK